MAAIDHTSGRAFPTPSAAASSTRGKLPVVVWIYLLAIVMPIGFWAGPLFMTTLRLLLLVMTVPLMINIIMGKYGKVYVTDFLFVAHIVWAAIAIGINNPDQMIQQVGSVGIEFLGGYAIGRAFIRNQEDFAALCRVLVLIVLCITPFALYETMTGRPILVEILHKLPGIRSVAIVNIEARMGLERVQSLFAHPIHHGLFCSVAFSLCFVALNGTMSTTRRFLTGIIIAFNGFLALSSGALTAIAMQFFFIMWAFTFNGFKQRWWLLVGVFALGYVTIDLLSNRSPLKVFMSYATFSAHNAYWRSIIFDWGLANIIGSSEKGIIGSPLYGIGLHDWVRPSFMHSGSMDNFWLVIGVRYGLPGLFFLALGYIISITRIMRKNFEGDVQLTLFRRAWVFTFLGLTFTLCTVHVWTNIYSFIFFMFGAGIWLISAQPNAAKTIVSNDENGGSPLNTDRPNPYTRFPARLGPTPQFTRGTNNRNFAAKASAPEMEV